MNQRVTACNVIILVRNVQTTRQVVSNVQIIVKINRNVLVRKDFMKKEQPNAVYVIPNAKHVYRTYYV
jgi:uncharacterized protein YwlG (UPF0340 family)